MVGKSDDARSASRAELAASFKSGTSKSVSSGIRAARRRRGLSLGALAAQIDLDKGYLSRLERGEKTPSIEALLRIADALGVQVSQLFGEQNDEEAITVVRGGDQAEPSEALGTLTQVLIPSSSTRRLSAFFLEPSKDREIHRHAEHPGDELLYVLAGSIEISFTDRLVTLSQGDCVYFDGHLRHHIRSKGRNRARVLVIVA